MSHRGAASSAMPQHQRRRHGPTAAGAATGSATMKTSRGKGAREGFHSGLCLVPPQPSPSFRPGHVRPARLRTPTHADSKAQTFFLLSGCCFYLAPPWFGVWVAFFFSSCGSPPHTPCCAAVGQGWSTRQPQTPIFGAERPKDERRVDAQARCRSYTEPSSTQPAATWGQLPSQGLRRSVGQKFSYRGGKRKGGDKQGRL